jgi:hypothetical protein
LLEQDQGVECDDHRDAGDREAAVGYDLASGLGVPNWAVLPACFPRQADLGGAIPASWKIRRARIKDDDSRI